jgi:hypothetical protein
MASSCAKFVWWVTGTTLAAGEALTIAAASG